MSISEQVITVVQSGAIPLLAILTGIAVLSIMKVPGKETSGDAENFKMKESYFWLLITVYCVVASALLFWLSATNRIDSQKASNYVMIIICAVGFVVTLYMYFKRKLVVAGDEVTYYPVTGKAETFSVKTFSKMEVIEKDTWEEMLVYNKTGKLLFKVHGYMTNSELLKKYMRQHRVRIVKINMEK